MEGKMFFVEMLYSNSLHNNWYIIKSRSADIIQGFFWKPLDVGGRTQLLKENDHIAGTTKCLPTRPNDW